MFWHRYGSKTDPRYRFCAQCGAELPGADGASDRNAPAEGTSSKEHLLRELEQALGRNPKLVVTRGDRTDLEISSVLADAKWFLGKRKVEYNACLLAKETERTVVFWEIIKESGFGIPILGGFQVETFRTDWKTRSGTAREVGYGPKGKMIDYGWEYGEIRKVVEDTAEANGWKLKVVLRKSQALR